MDIKRKVVIGIQARTTSTRFPGKVFQKIDDKEMLQHVLDAADGAAQFINKFSDKNMMKVSTVLLIPTGDEIKKRYEHETIIFEGPEHDVLKRYRLMSDRMKPDFVVRITSDCPLIPPFLIAKHINVALALPYDYTSNVDPVLRTSIDGHDVEVMSRKALEWADDSADNEGDREHVTAILRTKKIPTGFKVAHVIGHLYQPHLKLSVDTPEDLQLVKREYQNIKMAIQRAIDLSGPKSVHRV